MNDPNDPKAPIGPRSEAESQAALDEEFARAAFASLQPIEPSAELRRRVAEIPVRHPRAAGAGWWPFEKFFQPIFGMVGALALGLLIGAQDGLFGLEETAVMEAETTELAVDLPDSSAGASELAEREASGEQDIPSPSNEQLSELELEFELAFGGHWDDREWLEMETL